MRFCDVKKNVLAMALLLASALPALGQTSSGSISANDASGVCTTANACVVVQLPSNPSTVATVAFTASGTFSGTLNFLVAQDSNLALP